MSGPRKPPKQNRPSTGPIPAVRWKVLLDKLAETANITRSCEFAMIHDTTVWVRRRDDPEFAKVFNEALQRGWDKMEEECQRRAFHGFEEPVFYKGKKVATVTKFSDALAMFLLKGNKPEKFKERLETSGAPGSPVSRYDSLTDEELEAELKKRGRR